MDARQWLCLAAKFGVERKKGEGALKREKKEGEREHLRDREKQKGFGISGLVSEVESGTV